MNTRCVIQHKHDEFFADIVEGWDYPLGPLKKEVLASTERKLRVWGSWEDANEGIQFFLLHAYHNPHFTFLIDVVKKYIDVVLELCFEELNVTDKVVNTEKWLESINILMG